MALTNPKRFGLNVLSFLTDVQDKEIALSNLNLPLRDLDVIRGSSDAGADRHDWISFSRLSVPIHKNLRRFLDDSSVFSSAINNRAGIQGILFGGIEINGILSGNAIRYRYVDGVGGSASIKIADISTSRASAWSSTVPEPIPATAPISYGAQLKVNGDIKFGTQSGITGRRLQTTQNAQAKEFDSEFPTHKMRIKLNPSGDNSNTDLKEVYLMKGIPVVFRGFFRNLNADIKINLINNIPASWKIVERNNTNAYSNFANLGGTTSSLRYRASSGKERLIQFYYNPDNITSIVINSANIFELPAVRLAACVTFNLASNTLNNFPDLNFATPIVQNLNLASNRFYLSEDPNERRLTATVMNKIPQTVTILNLSSAFRGSVDNNVIADRLPILTTLRLNGGFFNDGIVSGTPLPNVSSTVETYDVGGSDFRSFDTSDPGNNRYNVQTLPNLKVLSLSGNYYLTGAINIASNVIQSINLHNSGLQIPTGIIGSSTLTTFEGSYMRSAGSFFTGTTYKFENCSALSSINLSRAGLSGAFPIFSNINLSSLNIMYTSIVGGTIDGDTSNSIPKDTFSLATELRNVNILSSSLLTTPIHPDALSPLKELTTFQYYSYGRTGGPLPNFGNNTKLVNLYLSRNAFTGTPPNLTAFSDLYYVDISFNQLTGNVPGYRNLSSLHFLYLHNNNLTGLNKFVNLANLRRFYVHNNQITGTIPDFSGCTRLDYLILFNNQFTDYTQDAFSSLTRVKYIDVSGNNLSQLAVDTILEDSIKNYNSAPRRGVTINLRNNATPSELGQENVLLLRSFGWNITHS